MSQYIPQNESFAEGYLLQEFLLPPRFFLVFPERQQQDTSRDMLGRDWPENTIIKTPHQAYMVDRPRLISRFSLTRRNEVTR